ncbi:MAG TPA: hypothetical protein DDX92_00340 [Flavobacteriales bacterium]|jgi:ABC-type multidrug transport system fused ATPase/permease subunit|nr:hypothetical protein [Flavobacteriales bacterium]
MDQNSNSRIRPKSSIILGTIVMILGFLSPLLIPFVVNSTLSLGLKSLISGLLAFGIPELFMLAGVAIMGKDGFQYLKRILNVLLWRYGPPEYVSPIRYKIGLAMFVFPFIYFNLIPYINLGSVFDNNTLIINILVHFLWFSSLFVLGGDFWEKLRSLFYASTPK